MSTFVNLLEIVYPVGSYYITTSSTSPASSFGGTWSCVNNSFYPETLKSDASPSNVSTGPTVSYNKYHKINGIGFSTIANYNDGAVMKAGEYLVADAMTASGNYMPAMTMAVTPHFIGGAITYGAGWCGDDILKPTGSGSFKLLDNKYDEKYFGASSVYPIKFSGVKSYIWKRTA